MKRKVIKVCFFTVVGTLFTLMLVGFIFQDRIISAAMQSFRKNLRTRITIGTASFSLIKDFPYASIKLTDVSILSTKDINIADFRRYRLNDTLLKAQSLNLKLNMLDLIANKIAIKQVKIKNGDLKLLIDQHGNTNYKIFKSNSESSGDVTFNVDGARLENTKLGLYDLNRQTVLATFIKSLKSDGRFSATNFNTKSKSELRINQLMIGGITYITDKEFKFDGKIKVKGYKFYNFEDFELIYKSNKINLDGGFDLSSKTRIDLKAEGKELVLKEINELVPHVNKSLEKINFEGKVNIKAKATGYWTGTQRPFLYGEFDVKGGKSELLKDNSIASVNLVGSFSNGRGNISNAFLRIDSFKVNSNFGDFEGKFSLTNFSRPLVSLSTSFNLIMKNLNEAYKIDSTKQLDGIIIGNVTAGGHVDFNELSPLRLIRLINNGTFKLSEVHYPIKGTTYTIRKGDVSFSPIEAHATLSCSSSSLNGDLRISIENFYDGIMDSMPFAGTISGKTTSIDFDKLLAINFNQKVNTNSHDINVANLNIDISSKKAVLHGIPISNLEAHIEKSGPLIAVTQLKGDALGGSIGLVGKVLQNPNKSINTDLYTTLDSINIETLFKSFQNFDQTMLTNDNIKGTASGDVAFRGTFSSQGKLDIKTVDCVTNISISNGRLVRFTPAQKLSRFIDLKELEDIRFANLKNQITIRNEVINIPAMYIGSSAINLGLIGTHSFNGDYSYRLKLALKDVLFKKARSGLRKQVSQADFEDNTLLYFKIEGNNKTSKVSYDWSGRGWELPTATPVSQSATPSSPSSSSKPNAKPSTGAPVRVEWDDAKPTAPKVSKPTAKPAEQPHQTSYKEEREAEKRAAEKKKKDTGNVKVIWEDEP